MIAPLPSDTPRHADKGDRRSDAQDAEPHWWQDGWRSLKQQSHRVMRRAGGRMADPARRAHMGDPHCVIGLQERNYGGHEVIRHPTNPRRERAAARMPPVPRTHARARSVKNLVQLTRDPRCLGPRFIRGIPSAGPHRNGTFEIGRVMRNLCCDLLKNLNKIEALS